MADNESIESTIEGGPFMLTTIDNPYDPFTQWKEWFAFDTSNGYHSCALLARITVTSDDLSELDQEVAIQLAIDEVVRENVSGVHRKVSREDGKLIDVTS